MTPTPLTLSRICYQSQHGGDNCGGCSHFLNTFEGQCLPCCYQWSNAMAIQGGNGDGFDDVRVIMSEVNEVESKVNTRRSEAEEVRSARDDVTSGVEGLIKECQRHWCAISACTDLQQVVKDEMTKQARFENVIYHKMSSRAQRLQRLSSSVTNDAVSLDWLFDGMGDLAAKLGQHADIHRSYTKALTKQSSLIQRSLDSHHRVMKAAFSLATTTAEGSQGGQGCLSMETPLGDFISSSSSGMTYMEACCEFETLKAKRLQLSKKLDFLQQQKKSAAIALNEYLNGPRENKDTSKSSEIKNTKPGQQFESLLSRLKLIEDDIKRAMKDVAAFDLTHLERVRAVLCVFSQHRERCETALKKSLSLLEGVSLGDTSLTQLSPKWTSPDLCLQPGSVPGYPVGHEATLDRTQDGLYNREYNVRANWSYETYDDKEMDQRENETNGVIDQRSHLADHEKSCKDSRNNEDYFQNDAKFSYKTLAPCAEAKDNLQRPLAQNAKTSDTEQCQKKATRYDDNFLTRKNIPEYEWACKLLIPDEAGTRDSKINQCPSVNTGFSDTQLYSKRQDQSVDDLTLTCKLDKPESKGLDQERLRDKVSQGYPSGLPHHSTKHTNKGTDSKFCKRDLSWNPRNKNTLPSRRSASMDFVRDANEAYLKSKHRSGFKGPESYLESELSSKRNVHTSSSTDAKGIQERVNKSSKDSPRRQKESSPQRSNFWEEVRSPPGDYVCRPANQYTIHWDEKQGLKETAILSNFENDLQKINGLKQSKESEETIHISTNGYENHFDSSQGKEQGLKVSNDVSEHVENQLLYKIIEHGQSSQTKSIVQKTRSEDSSNEPLCSSSSTLNTVVDQPQDPQEPRGGQKCQEKDSNTIDQITTLSSPPPSERGLDLTNLDKQELRTPVGFDELYSQKFQSLIKELETAVSGHPSALSERICSLLAELGSVNDRIFSEKEKSVDSELVDQTDQAAIHSEFDDQTFRRRRSTSTLKTIRENEHTSSLEKEQNAESNDVYKIVEAYFEAKSVQEDRIPTDHNARRFSFTNASPWDPLRGAIMRYPALDAGKLARDSQVQTGSAETVSNSENNASKPLENQEETFTGTSTTSICTLETSSSEGVTSVPSMDKDFFYLIPPPPKLPEPPKLMGSPKIYEKIHKDDPPSESSSARSRSSSSSKILIDSNLLSSNSEKYDSRPAFLKRCCLCAAEHMMDVKKDSADGRRSTQVVHDCSEANFEEIEEIKRRSQRQFGARQARSSLTEKLEEKSHCEDTRGSEIHISPTRSQVFTIKSNSPVVSVIFKNDLAVIDELQPWDHGASSLRAREKPRKGASIKNTEKTWVAQKNENELRARQTIDDVLRLIRQRIEEEPRELTAKERANTIDQVVSERMFNSNACKFVTGTRQHQAHHQQPVKSQATEEENKIAQNVKTSFKEAKVCTVKPINSVTAIAEGDTSKINENSGPSDVSEHDRCSGASLSAKTESEYLRSYRWLSDYGKNVLSKSVSQRKAFENDEVTLSDNILSINEDQALPVAKSPRKSAYKNNDKPERLKTSTPIDEANKGRGKTSLSKYTYMFHQDQKNTHNVHFNLQLNTDVLKKSNEDIGHQPAFTRNPQECIKLSIPKRDECISVHPATRNKDTQTTSHSGNTTQTRHQSLHSSNNFIRNTNYNFSTESDHSIRHSEAKAQQTDGNHKRSAIKIRKKSHTDSAKDREGISLSAKGLSARASLRRVQFSDVVHHIAHDASSQDEGYSDDGNQQEGRRNNEDSDNADETDDAVVHNLNFSNNTSSMEKTIHSIVDNFLDLKGHDDTNNTGLFQDADDHDTISLATFPTVVNLDPSLEDGDNSDVVISSNKALDHLPEIGGYGPKEAEKTKWRSLCEKKLPDIHNFQNAIVRVVLNLKDSSALHSSQTSHRGISLPSISNVSRSPDIKFENRILASESHLDIYPAVGPTGIFLKKKAIRKMQEGTTKRHVNFEPLDRVSDNHTYVQPDVCTKSRLKCLKRPRKQMPSAEAKSCSCERLSNTEVPHVTLEHSEINTNKATFMEGEQNGQNRNRSTTAGTKNQDKAFTNTRSRRNTTTNLHVHPSNAAQSINSQHAKSQSCLRSEAIAAKSEESSIGKEKWLLTALCSDVDASCVRSDKQCRLWLQAQVRDNLANVVNTHPLETLGSHCQSVFIERVLVAKGKTCVDELVGSYALHSWD